MFGWGDVLIGRGADGKAQAAGYVAPLAAFPADYDRATGISPVGYHYPLRAGFENDVVIVALGEIAPAFEAGGEGLIGRELPGGVFDVGNGAGADFGKEQGATAIAH